MARLVKFNKELEIIKYYLPADVFQCQKCKRRVLGIIKAKSTLSVIYTIFSQNTSNTHLN